MERGISLSFSIFHVSPPRSGAESLAVYLRTTLGITVVDGKEICVPQSYQISLPYFRGRHRFFDFYRSDYNINNNSSTSRMPNAGYDTRLAHNTSRKSVRPASQVTFAEFTTFNANLI